MATMPTVGGYKAVGKLYNALMTGLVLRLVSHKGAVAATQFVEGHFRRQHLEKFLPGLKKLALDGLPDAVACAQYHYFSNALGGVKTEYFAESDTKAWVRYPPPRWIWQGAAICGIPTQVNAAMLYGWHGHNGVSLGNPRLGFVCTGQTVDGSPGLEGYYLDYGYDIAQDERVRFAYDEPTPDYDPDLQPKLNTTDWPEERLQKIERAYAMEYVRSLVSTMLELFGPDETRQHLGHVARLIGMQFYDETAALIGTEPQTMEAFAKYLAAIAAAQGEKVKITKGRDSIVIDQTGWRLLNDVTRDPAVFDAWNELWIGALSVHNRRLRLEAIRENDDIKWHLSF